MDVELEKRIEMQNKLIYKILAKVREPGFQQLKMEEIAKIMDVSRATLYKYFSNKEEIITRIAEGLIEYIEEMETPNFEFPIRFQQYFEQEVSLALLVTNEYLKDLKDSYPLIYEKIDFALTTRNNNMLMYFKKGIAEGVFNNLNGHLLLLQNQLFNQLFDAKYLIANQLTIEQALWDFYQLQKIQTFKPSELTKVDDDLMTPRIDYLTKKIKNILY